MKANAGNANKPEDIQGKPGPVDGKYHVQIKAARTHKKDGTPMDSTCFELEVLAGTVPGQVGKEMPFFARLGENHEETDEYCLIVSRLAMAIGILKPREQREIQPDEFEGGQFIVGWETWESKGKKGQQVGNRGLATWAVDSPEVADVPKSADTIRLWREATGQTGRGSSQTGQPSQPSGGTQDDLLL